MKKTLIKLALLLVVISMITMACGSDKKDAEKKESKSTLGSSSKKVSGSKNSDDNTETNSDSGDYAYGDHKTNAVMDANIQTFKDDLAKSCVDTKTAYDKFKVAGDTDDGWQEVDAASESMITVFYGTDEFQLDQWPQGEQEYDSDGLYQKEIYPIIESLGKISYKMSDAFNDSSHDVNDVHVFVREYEDAVNNSGYATCNITK